MNNKNFNPKLTADDLFAAKSGDTNALINKLSEKDKKTLNAVLSDKKALMEVLKSPEAAAIMKLLGKTDKNG